ncbi:MAG: hypothetical protein AELANPGJ_02059 [Anaerolineae bacterium]|nr:hypothetical protein [Anaerolineae bacterium]
MSDLSQESPLWREWADSRHSVQQMREELDRLIAAAPELVEALRMAVAADTAEDWSRAVDYARAALAKANGGGNG